MQSIFNQFLTEKEYLNNVSPSTIKYLGWCFAAYKRHVGEHLPTKDNLKAFVISLQQSGVTPGTTNSYIRGFNSFLTWLHENGHTPEHLRIKKVKAGEQTLKVFSEDHLKRLLTYKPKTFSQHRLYAMICLAIDGGCRIDEILSLTWQNVFLDNLLINSPYAK